MMKQEKNIIKKFAPMLVNFAIMMKVVENKLNFFWIGGYLFAWHDMP